MDVGRLTAVVLLDLSAAFDAVNHNILLNTLSPFGISGRALDWFTSYLSDRQQLICVGSAKSDIVALKHGVPQGSVGGPLLFSIYLHGLHHIIHSHNVGYHCYADDI